MSGRNWTPEDDELDGLLFLFCFRAAAYRGGWPARLMEVMSEEIKAEGHASPATYRRALIRLAQEKGVNLPIGGAA